jgi:asparagine synthase (glutamine-hydrolysing)
MYTLGDAHRTMGLWRTVNSQFAAPLLQPLREFIQGFSGDPPWRQYSAIHPDFAARLGITNRMKQAGHDPGFGRRTDSVAARHAVIRPGRSHLGALWQDNGAAFGLEVRDPTLDKRVLEFCLGVPEDQFLHEGRDRMLIRRAMKGYLPDTVRSNARRGRQAADLVYRLRVDRAEMDAALGMLRASPSAQMVLDLEKMEQVWRAVQGRVDSRTTAEAVTVLTRGLMAGLYLLTFETSGIK